MALRLSQPDQEFRNRFIFTGDAKTIDLDRVLLNLFMLIKYHGVRPTPRRGRKTVTTETFVKQLIKRESEGLIHNFSSNEDVVHCWVKSNLVDMVNRGNPEKETVVSLRAIHLNAYQYRNPKHARDYYISEQVYNMLIESPVQVVTELRDFLEIGWDKLSESIAANPDLDLDTLGILRIIEKGIAKETPSGDNTYKPVKCLCTGQARVFADDVRRLLVYKRTVPRHVLLEYLRTLIGIHVGLYLLKLFKLLPDWVKRGTRHSVCKNCPIQGNADAPFKDCPYHSNFIVDCGNDPDSDMAALSVEDAALHYARIHDYIRATFAINMALQFLQKTTDQRKPEDLDEAMAVIKEMGPNWDPYFNIRLQNLFSGIDENDKELFRPILDLNLPPFDTFIEVVTQARASFHFHYHRQMIDSLFQSNRESGLIWSGRSRRYKRRFWLSSRLLETLVQLSVLKINSDQNSSHPFCSEPILIDDFVNWLENRYGFIINGVGHERFQSAGIMIHQAFKENTLRLKERLREIGFFSVLSDAYIMQRIRPRYPIKHSEEA